MQNNSEAVIPGWDQQAERVQETVDITLGYIRHATQLTACRMYAILHYHVATVRAECPSIAHCYVVIIGR